MSTILEQFTTTNGVVAKKVLDTNGVIRRFRDGTPINAKQYAGLARHRETTEERPEVPRPPPVDVDVSLFDFEDQSSTTSDYYSKRVEWSFDEEDIFIQVYPTGWRKAQLTRLMRQHDGRDWYSWSVRATSYRDGEPIETSRMRTRIAEADEWHAMQQDFERKIATLREIAAQYGAVIVHETKMTAWDEA